VSTTSLTDRLDAVVRDNRFTIAVVFPLVGAMLLLASGRGWIPPSLDWLSFNPWLILVGVTVMRSPLIVGLAPVATRRLGVGLIALTAYTYGIEALGLATGWPYGSFTYEVSLGPTVDGLPIALPILFLPLVFDAYLLASLRTAHSSGRWARVGLAVGLVVTLDLVLDPAAVSLGFWRYANPGLFHEVPWTNVAGWVLSAAVTVGVVEATIDRERLRARVDGCEFLLDDLVSFVVLWGAINLAFGNLAPAAIAVGVGVALLTAEGFQTRGLVGGQ
jgi:putative membrane protein